MFVRFRQARQRLQVSLIATSRVDGKVRHEHVASFGAVGMPLSVADRVNFWRQLHERLGQLSNRLDAAGQAKVMGEVHARIPMPTGDEIRAIQRENIEADERLWGQLAEMQAERAEGNRQLAATAERTAAEAQAEADKARAEAEAAADRLDRLKRGEAVAGGLGEPVDIERVLREAGWTARDFNRARQTHAISELGGFEELLEEINKRHRWAEDAARRVVLRKRWLAAARSR
jgi:hypothetical protein